MSPLLTLGGSLVAVLGLALVARLLGLGGGGIASEAEAIAAAEAMVPGFEGVRAVVGADRRGALVWGREGDAALLKLHGAQIAARRLAPGFAPAATPQGLRIASGERRFGDVVLAGVTAL